MPATTTPYRTSLDRNAPDHGDAPSTTPTIKIMHLLLDKDVSFPLIENQILHMDPKRFQQIICYLSGNENTLLEQSGYRVIALGVPKNKLRRYRLSLLLAIVKIIRTHGIDLIHCQRHKQTVYGTLAGWLARRNVKIITTVHGRNRTRTLSRKFLNWFLFKNVSRILTVSGAVREDVLTTNMSLPRDKVVTVYNGIDTNHFSNTVLTPSEARERLGLPPEGTLIFGTVARLAPTKAQDVLLKAYAAVKDRCPDSLLVLTGAGPLESELRQLASDLGIDQRVIFLGQRTDIPRVLRAYDVFILPSLSEGHPLSLLEAMAAGIPVISTTIGGVQEVLADDSPGMMVAPSSVEELATAMERVSKMDRPQREAIGQQLRDRVLAEFTTENMAAAITKQYLDVMNESP